jgi:sn-glycerol 3-phosphate transport system ATP-binding protein
LPALSLQNVQKTYDKAPIISGLDLTIENGEFVVFLGPSGCGKSTLLRMVAGLESITGGTISIADKVVNKLEPRERGIAMVFQNYALYPHMTVAENIGYGLKVSGARKADRDKRVADIARILGIEEYLDRRPAQLSGGQRQRVAMGRAMIREPKLFLFDEPLSNLDAKLRVQMRVEIRRLHNRLNTTSIFVTHDQVEAMTLADRLVVMNKGNIEQVGTPAEVYGRPATRFVAEFIGSPPMNLLPGIVDGAGALRLDGDVTLAQHPDWAQYAGPVTAGFRPEDAVPAPDAANGPALAVDFIEELGAGRLIHGAFNNHDVTLTQTAGPKARVGETLRFVLPPEAIHFFHNQTGLRLN